MKPISLSSAHRLIKTLSRLRRVVGSLVAIGGLVALGAAPLSASAQTQGGAQPNGAAQLQQIAYDWLQPALAAAMGQADTGALRPEIVLGALDSRLRLAECYRVEPYLPPGTRLWGRSRIGLRCVDGPVRWNVFLPVTVRAWGPAWVLKRPVTAGSILVQEDADIAEIDWAEQFASVVANPESWIGQQAAYSLPAGQAIRQNMVKPVPVFKPGAQVRVISSGAGFQVTAIGRALSDGIEGQSVRIQLKGGRIVTGTVRNGQVEDVLL